MIQNHLDEHYKCYDPESRSRMPHLLGQELGLLVLSSHQAASTQSTGQLDQLKHCTTSRHVGFVLFFRLHAMMHDDQRIFQAKLHVRPRVCRHRNSLDGDELVSDPLLDERSQNASRAGRDRHAVDSDSCHLDGRVNGGYKQR